VNYIFCNIKFQGILENFRLFWDIAENKKRLLRRCGADNGIQTHIYDPEPFGCLLVTHFFLLHGFIYRLIKLARLLFICPSFGHNKTAPISVVHMCIIAHV
jgi:hypothetical protein